MNKIELTNPNYCATVVKIDKVNKLDGCDNLVGINLYGYSIISHKSVDISKPMVLFTAETSLSPEFLRENNLYSSSVLNADVTKKGYIGRNGRVRAIKLRGHSSNAMLMPLSSFTNNPDELIVGTSFNKINGKEICKKYEIEKAVGEPRNKTKGVSKKYERIDGKMFPEHFSTEQFLRNEHKFNDDDEIIITQKLHGTSVRFGHIEVKIKPTFIDRILRRQRTEYDYLTGSRRVIKDLRSNVNFQHFYETNPGEKDIYNRALDVIKDTLPKDVMFYGEIIGYNGLNSPIQKGYTYNIPDGSFEIYIYRIASVNKDGRVFDWSWDAMREFADINDLNLVPEIGRIRKADLDVERFMNINYSEELSEVVDGMNITDEMVSLPKGTVDEGICIRKEGLSPYVAKAKCSKFFEFETKLLDDGVEVAG